MVHLSPEADIIVMGQVTHVAVVDDDGWCFVTKVLTNERRCSHLEPDASTLQ